MFKKYLTYDAIEFAGDEYFLQWRMFLDEDSDEFWKNFMESYPEKKSDIFRAIRIVDSCRINEFELTQTELLTEWTRIQDDVKQINGRKAWLKWTSVAASLAVLVTLSIIGTKFGFDTKTDKVITDQSYLPTDDIQLFLPDRSPIIFNTDAEITIQSGQNIEVSNSKNETLYEGTLDADEAKYSRLLVPKGKRSSLVLADGTKIWLNSGTTLEFPAVFGKNERSIRVNGEVYLEVVKSEIPFVVYTPWFSVDVLGTKFNISAYKEDIENSVVLVQGAVQVKLPDQQQKIRMNAKEMLAVNGSEHSLSRVDVYDYISWKDGIFRLSDESLEKTCVRLSRYYNVKLEISPDLTDYYIAGKLVLCDDLEQVLDNIKEILPLDYKKMNKEILITKKQSK